MFELIIRGERVIDPLNKINDVLDIAVEDGKISKVAAEISGPAKQEIHAEGKIVVPGIIDMHTHMRTVLGHKHAQRMITLAGVCTTLDMAGPLEDILTSIPQSGSGVNIAVLEAAREGQTLSTSRPSEAEQEAFIEKTLELGGIGIKLLGGHFPMDIVISESFITLANKHKAWIGWHARSTQHGSNIEDMREAVNAAGEDKFLHIAHINSYCRGQISNETEEALEAIELLKTHPNIFSESYLSPLNGTRLIVKDDVPLSNVTVTCLKKGGYNSDYAGMKQAIIDGYAGVLVDDGTIGKLLSGADGAEYWESKNTACTGSFAVNPAVSRFLLASASEQTVLLSLILYQLMAAVIPETLLLKTVYFWPNSVRFL